MLTVAPPELFNQLSGRKDSMKHVIDSVANIAESPILTHGTRPWYDANDRDGETVLSYDHVLHAPGSTASFLEFCVKKITPGKGGVPDDVNGGNEYYIAATPYRKEVCCGVSPQEAIGMLLFSVANLARMGAMNPSIPDEPGDPPIQHAMHILTERLLWQVERRHGNIHDAKPIDVLTYGEVAPDTVRCGEIIAALSTAISALARVVDNNPTMNYN